MSNAPSRREIICSTLAGAAAASVAPVLLAQGAPARPKLRKAVKYDMIKLDGPAEKRLELVKSIGFEGVEVNSPSGVNREELLAASKKTGVVIHGTIDSVHWNERLSDPDSAVREK